MAFFFPEHLRLDGSNPAYEVYLDKEKRQFITYNSLIPEMVRIQVGQTGLEAAILVYQSLLDQRGR